MSTTLTGNSLQKLTIRAMQPGDDGTPFRTLNEEWITHFFTMEPKDREVLGNPQASILSKGGHVFFAEIDGRAVACCALLPETEGVYELSKMAVSPELRGQGIGRRLLEHTVAEARRFGARSLYLGSNSTLRNAVHLYESLGFQHVPPERVPVLYSRSDVFMELDLQPPATSSR